MIGFTLKDNFRKKGFNLLEYVCLQEDLVALFSWVFQHMHQKALVFLDVCSFKVWLYFAL